MKITYLKITAITIIALAFTSCSSIRVSYYSQTSKKVNNVALVSTMIDKIEQSPIPLIDAAIFNGKTNKIADQIMDLQKQSVDKYREIIANSIKSNFNCKVIYADTLHNMAGFDVLKEKYNFKDALRLKSNNFPLIITAKDDINPFMFENGNVPGYFRDKQKYKTTISEIAKQLNTEYVVVSYSRLSAGANSWGITGMMNLVTILYIFDNDGNLVSDASNMSKITNITGKEIEEYKDQLDNISLIIDPMLKAIVTKFQGPSAK